jgi:hypothetical protein
MRFRRRDRSTGEVAAKMAESAAMADISRHVHPVAKTDH